MDEQLIPRKEALEDLLRYVKQLLGEKFNKKPGALEVEIEAKKVPSSESELSMKPEMEDEESELHEMPDHSMMEDKEMSEDSDEEESAGLEVKVEPLSKEEVLRKLRERRRGK